MFVISPCLTRSIRYGMNNVRLTEDAILTIFVKRCDAKPKRITNMAIKLASTAFCSCFAILTNHVNDFWERMHTPSIGILSINGTIHHFTRLTKRI